MSDPPRWTRSCHNFLYSPFKWCIDRKKPSRSNPVDPSTSRPHNHHLSTAAEDKKSEIRRRPIKQLDSPIFRLPPEIRLQIYEHVLGGKLFHIGIARSNQNPKKLGRPRRLICRHGDTHPRTQSTWTHCSTLYESSRNNLMPLLKSCRSM